MKLISFATVFAIHLSILNFGLRSVAVETMGILALAFTVLTIGGLRLVKLR